MEAFVTRHELQLHGCGLPDTLYSRLHEKLSGATFDAGQFFKIIQRETDDSLEVELHALQNLQPHCDVFLIDHAWTFRLTQMRDMLTSNPQLRRRMKALCKLWSRKLLLPNVNYAEDEEPKPHLGSCLTLDGQSLETLACIPVAPEVTMLSVSENQLIDLASVLPVLPQLKALWIDENPVCDSEAKEAELLTMLETQFPTLEMFNRELTRSAGQWALLYCGNSDSPQNITKLNLRGRNIERCGIQLLAACPAVTHVDMRDNHYANHEEALRVLAALPNLEVLQLDAHLERFIWQDISSFRTLKRLNGWHVSKGRPSSVDKICAVLPRIAAHYRMATEQSLDETSVWYVMDELGCAILHSDVPNVKVVPFIYQDEQGTFTAYSIMWPVAPIQLADIIYRDFLGGVQAFRSERLSVLYRVPEKVYIGLFYKWLTSNTAPSEVRCALPEPLRVDKAQLSIWTDLGFFRETLTDPRFVWEDGDHPDIIWSHGQVITEGEWQMKVHEDQFVNQFPYEGCLVMKSKLAHTLQRFGNCPAWFPRSYDLTQDVSAFLGDYYFREVQGADNHWIVKPIGMARGLDTWVTSNVDLIMQLMSTGPKVCQKYLDTPLLIGGSKFDLRFIVLVQSFIPLRLFVYKRFWVRSANNPFTLAYDKDFDYETHFTVMNYSAHRMQTIMDVDFIARLAEEHHKDWAEVQLQVYQCMKEAFLIAAQAEAGLEHEHSRAIYGIDLMLDAEFRPNLLEVNFCPDCTRATKQFPSFANDVFNCLFFGELNNIEQLCCR